MQYFLDLDGVIVDFVGGIIKWHKLKCTVNDVTEWNALYKYWPGTIAEFWEELPESFWENLNFTPEGPAIIDLLAEEGIKATILTSPPWAGATGKQRWIQKNLPEYFDHDRYLIGPSKTCVARPGAVLIDDAEHNIDSWVAAGGQGILVPRPWNRNREQNTLDWVICAIKYMKGLH